MERQSCGETGFTAAAKPEMTAQRVSAPIEQHAYAVGLETVLASVFRSWSSAAFDERQVFRRVLAILDQHGPDPRGNLHFFVSRLALDGAFKLGNFLTSLGNLMVQASENEVSSKDGLLQLDHLLREFCRDLRDLSPVTGSVRGLDDVDQVVDSGKAAGNGVNHGGPHVE